MIEVQNIDERVIVIASIRPPAIYLDHWAINEISANPAVLARFSDIFKTKGTLLFTLANTFDISGIQGDALDRTALFLDGVGENWFPLEMNPAKVMRAEKEYSEEKNPPYFADGFLESYFPNIYNRKLTLKEIVNLVTENNGSAPVFTSVGQTFEEMAKMFELFRAKRSSDPKLKGQIPSADTFNVNRPTKFVYESLIYLMFAERFRLYKNQMVDFFHSTVALSYSEFVLLDKLWENLATKIKSPRPVRVYSQPGLLDFINDLEKWTTPWEGKKMIVANHQKVENQKPRHKSDMKGRKENRLEQP